MPGVLETKIGHLGGSEVVSVAYDSGKVDVEALAMALKSRSSLHSVVVSSQRERDELKASLHEVDIKIDGRMPRFIESKYSLRTQHPDLYYLDLTEEQAMAFNSWSYFGGKMPDVLTADQLVLHLRLQQKFKSKRPKTLNPERMGQGRDKYRKELLKWLAE